MRVGRRGDEHRADLGIGEGLALAHHLGAVSRGELLRRVGVDVDDVAQPRVLACAAILEAWIWPMRPAPNWAISSILFVYDKSRGSSPVATVRMSMAEALVRFLAAQEIVIGGKREPLFAGVWAIFGHGNVAGLGPALHAARRKLPTLRAHNEQAMAHAAIAFAKAHARRRMMACTTSIGPGASNMVTAAAVAHVNRLPVLFLPGDVFASRRPDPVLQQLEAFGDPTLSVNDCFRPVSRYFDRITATRAAPHQPAGRACACCSIPRNAARRPWRCRRTCRPRPTTTRLSSFAAACTAFAGPSPDAR